MTQMEEASTVPRSREVFLDGLPNAALEVRNDSPCGQWYPDPDAEFQQRTEYFAV